MGEELIDAIYRVCSHATRTLIDSGASGDDIIQLALSRDNIETVKLIIGAGADVTRDDNQALINAVKRGDVKTLRLLIDAGADVTARDNEALMDAVRGGYVEIVKLLLATGADLYAQTHRAIRTAAQDNWSKIIPILVDYAQRGSVSRYYFEDYNLYIHFHRPPDDFTLLHGTNIWCDINRFADSWNYINTVILPGATVPKSAYSA
jgi:ankyrin repeat protein